TPSAQVQLHHAEALLRQHRFAEALEAFTAASAPPYTADQARWALGAGQALAGLRRFEEAGARLEVAARRAAASGDAELMAAAANAMGFLAFRQRRFAQAHEIFHEALQRLAAAGLQQTEVYGKLLANLGRVCVELGLPAQALDYLRLAAAQEDLDASLRLAGQCGDDEGVAQTLVELARLRARAGDAGGALRAAEDAASLATRIGDEAELARARAALADALAVAGRRDEAAVRYQEAVAGFQALGMTGDLIRVCRDLGFLLMQQEKGEEAARWFALAFSHQSPTTVLSMDRAP